MSTKIITILIRPNQPLKLILFVTVAQYNTNDIATYYIRNRTIRQERRKSQDDEHCLFVNWAPSTITLS